MSESVNDFKKVGEPAYINVTYSLHASLKINEIEEEHGFKWADVKDWWVKWDELHLILQGSENEGERQLSIQIRTKDDSYFDYKHPDHCTLFDKDFGVIEQR